MTEIRLLRADEIECRVGTDKNNKVMMLLYKDARVDMSILDEVFGIYGWQRTHEVINGHLFCTVQVFDKELNQWVKKQDVGTESNTEKEKGEASDSFKRACFNVGIGRELYTGPIVKFATTEADYYEVSGKKYLTSKFTVKEIGYNDLREINALTIVDQKGKERYKLGQVEPEEKAEPKPKVETKKVDLDYDDNLQIALLEVADCQLLIESTAVWNKWPAFQGDVKFQLEVAKKQVSFAKDVTEITTAWNGWKSLQTETTFVSACTAKKLTFK